MADTTLRINVDSAPIYEAIDALEKLVTVAERAKSAMEALGSTPVRVLRVGEVETLQIGDRA